MVKDEAHLGVPVLMGEVWGVLLRTKELASVQGGKAEAHLGVPVLMGGWSVLPEALKREYLASVQVGNVWLGG